MRINVPNSDLFILSDEDDNLWFAMNPDEYDFQPDMHSECFIVASGEEADKIQGLRELADACHRAIRELGGTA